MIRTFLARQPILDREGRIFAYELLFRSGYTASANIENSTKATARVIESLVSSFGLRNIIRDRMGFINIDEATEILKVVEILPPQRIGFEVLETSVLSDDFFEVLKRLKSSGYSLSLDDFVYNEEFTRFIDLVDYVKIDVLVCSDEAELERVLGLLHRFGVKLIAEKVETHQMYRRCLDMGFDYFQGFFFQKPEIVTSKTIEPAYAALIRLYNLIAGGAGIGEIEKIFKRFSELSLKLLQLINSAYYALRQPIKSIRHAILMLGYRNILRWILILMYSVKDEEFSADPLFEEASVRGFFMENLARKCLKDREMVEEAFITGVLSLVDVLLGVPMELVTEELMLEENIKRAILKREGSLGDLLRLVEGAQRAKILELAPPSGKIQTERCGFAAGSDGSPQGLLRTGSVVQTKRELTDSSSWILFIASPKRGATETTLSLPNILSPMGMVFVIMTCSMGELVSLSTAGPEKTPWVAQASTLLAPLFISMFAAATMVPAVSIRSSTIIASLPSISPTTSKTSALFGSGLLL